MNALRGTGIERQQYFLKVILMFLVGACIWFTLSNFFVGQSVVSVYNLSFVLIFSLCFFIRKTNFFVSMWITAVFYHVFIFGHAYFLLPGKQIEAGFGLALSLAPVFLTRAPLWIFLVINFTLYMMVLYKVDYDTIFIGQYGFFLVCFFVIRTVVNENRRFEIELAEQRDQIEKDAKALQRADRLKTNFFANITHELRTPLTLILSPLEGLRKRMAKSPTELNIIELIQRNANQLLVRVNELLEFTKLETTAEKQQLKPIILVSFTRDIVNLFILKAEEKGLRLLFESDLAENEAYLIDSRKWEIITSNLLSNAIKFTKEGEVKVITYKEDEYLIFQVTDTGIGIPSIELAHIFDRFHQAERSEYFEGSGIGLALVKELLNAMDGTISVKSEVNKGSTFTAKIPAIKFNLQSAVIDSSPANIDLPTTNFHKNTEVKAGHVWIAEDNKDLRTYLELILADDYGVKLFADGKLLWDHLNSATDNECPSLIITDLMMPVLTGDELIFKIKEDVRFRQIPVIALTAQLNADVRIRSLRIGVDDYLTKPFIEEEVLIRIGNLVRNAQLRRDDHLEKANDEALTVTAEEKGFLQNVETILLENTNNRDYKISDLARDLHMGVKTLQNKIKAETGLTPKQYQRSILLHAARNLILSGQIHTVSQLAEEMGFDDQHYFSTLYKKHFGLSPKQEIDRS